MHKNITNQNNEIDSNLKSIIKQYIDWIVEYSVNDK